MTRIICKEALITDEFDAVDFMPNVSEDTIRYRADIMLSSRLKSGLFDDCQNNSALDGYVGKRVV